jgi:hypothetical protein
MHCGFFICYNTFCSQTSLCNSTIFHNGIYHRQSQKLFLGCNSTQLRSAAMVHNAACAVAAALDMALSYARTYSQVLHGLFTFHYENHLRHDEYHVSFSHVVQLCAVCALHPQPAPLCQSSGSTHSHLSLFNCSCC